MKESLPKIKILFVCSGNIYRSMIAEYLLKKYLSQKNITDYEITSAGTGSLTKEPLPILIDILNSKKIYVGNHQKKPVNKELLKSQDLIICMSLEHQKKITKEYGLKSYIFNDLAKGKKTSVRDIPYDSEKNFAKKEIKKTLNHIEKQIPNIYKKLDQYFFLFDDIVNKKKPHLNNYKGDILYETKHSVIIMAINIPVKKEDHLLVIPKKRYKSLEEIPIIVLQDLTKTIKLAGNVLKRKYPAYNVLLNNGKEAEQNIFHVHFHLIPRFHEDDIAFEIWKSKKINETEFVQENNKIKKMIQDELRRNRI